MLQPQPSPQFASATLPGFMSTGAQTFGGNKTFTGYVESSASGSSATALYLSGAAAGYIQTASASMRFLSGVADGASAIAFKYDTVNSLSTSGARIASWQDAGSEVAWIGFDGSVSIKGAFVTTSDTIAINKAASAAQSFFFQGSGYGSIDVNAADSVTSPTQAAFQINILNTLTTGDLAFALNTHAGARMFTVDQEGNFAGSNAVVNGSYVSNAGTGSGAFSTALGLFSANVGNGIGFFSPNGATVASGGMADSTVIGIYPNAYAHVFFSTTSSMWSVIQKGTTTILPIATTDKLRADNSASASVIPVSGLVKKLEVFDSAGTSLGFIPVYSSIT